MKSMPLAVIAALLGAGIAMLLVLRFSRPEGYVDSEQSAASSTVPNLGAGKSKMVVSGRRDQPISLAKLRKIDRDSPNAPDAALAKSVAIEDPGETVGDRMDETPSPPGALIEKQAAIAPSTDDTVSIGVYSEAGIKSLPKTTAAHDQSGGSSVPLSQVQVADTLGQQIVDSILSTRKFTVVSRSDLNTLLKDQDIQSVLADPSGVNIAQAFKIVGCKYALVVTIDDFQDEQVAVQLTSGHTIATRRKVRLSSVAKVYDTTTGTLLESANFQLQKDTRDGHQGGATVEIPPHEELLINISREMAQQIANRVNDVIFPTKIIAITEKQVTVNRGDGAGIERGQVWKAYAIGKTVVDPDTKEVHGRKEVAIGKVKVINVTPKFSQALIIDDYGVAEGQILRLDLDAAQAE